jgi:acyl dehydratase
MRTDIRVGDSAAVTRRYTADDLAGFAALAGVPADSVDQVPEPLIGALFSYLLGVKVPGPGTNYLKQDIVFSQPVPLGEACTATVTVTRLRPDKHLCDLATVLTGADGRRLAEGRALVLVRDVGAAVHG